MVLSEAESIWRLIIMAPYDQRESVRDQLMQMDPAERRIFIAREEQRFWLNLSMSLRQARLD